MKRIGRYCLNVVIVCYLCIIYFAGVPETNTLNYRMKQKMTSVAMVLGIWPSWSMFAPNPIKFDSKSYVEVTYKDGTIKEYDVEKKTTGILAPFRKARWMKYSQDNLRNPKQKGLLAPAIRHFVHKYDSKENPVVSVKINRKWSEVHPFSNKSIHSIYQTPRKEMNEILVTQKVER
ncbi:hypothetical protein [Peredibacter starrii]|uniref:Uncharacterized protein n=1 Tax=Peredibacter starrii TaxID=28202 RepID=A0AAX4HRG1_9BACT|nr:hypothetical protein [Peredibacter starrii]WPU65929.1 hypothetical protein SOO65_04145 [Peredibacter starrii]